MTIPSSTRTAAARDLVAGTVVILDHGNDLVDHTVASNEESTWDDRVILKFTDGCHMYAVPEAEPFTLA